jgi:hypothetical protein
MQNIASRLVMYLVGHNTSAQKIGGKKKDKPTIISQLTHLEFHFQVKKCAGLKASRLKSF